MKKRMIALTLLATICVANLSACGQKGPLRLPSPTPAPSSTTITTLTNH